MDKHTRHGVPIDHDSLGPWVRSHLDEPRHVGASAAARTLRAELSVHRPLSESALESIVSRGTAELAELESRATEFIYRQAYRRRFGVRRLPLTHVRLDTRLVTLEQPTPWIIRDDARPYWLAYAPSFESALRVIYGIMRDERNIEVFDREGRA